MTHVRDASFREVQRALQKVENVDINGQVVLSHVPSETACPKWVNERVMSETHHLTSFLYEVASSKCSRPVWSI